MNLKKRFCRAKAEAIFNNDSVMNGAEVVFDPHDLSFSYQSELTPCTGSEVVVTEVVGDPGEWRVDEKRDSVKDVARWFYEDDSYSGWPETKEVVIAALVAEYEEDCDHSSKLYEMAERRVSGRRKLRKHADFILADLSEGDEHLAWVIASPVADIMRWVESCE